MKNENSPTKLTLEKPEIESITQNKKRSVHLFSIIRKILSSPYFWLMLLFPLSLLMVTLCRNINGLADWYEAGIYRVISKIGNLLSSTLPFSVGELLVLLLVPGVLCYLIIWLIQVIRSKGKRARTCGRFLIRLLSIVSVIFFLYTTNCGLNYYASDFAASSGMTIRKNDPEELYQVCVMMADHAAALRESLAEDENGVMKLDFQTVNRSAAEAVNALHQTYAFIDDGYAEPKNVMLSRGMSAFKITGVFFPFTFEANVNVDAPDYGIPFTMCHELAHLRGLMHEEDANFVAFLACIQSDDPQLQYSGYMMGMLYAGNALYQADRELFGKYAAHFSEKVRRDRNAHTEYWSQFETPVAKVASAVNDSYLRSNAQESGVRSYGQVVDLILAYYDDSD